MPSSSRPAMRRTVRTALATALLAVAAGASAQPGQGTLAFDALSAAAPTRAPQLGGTAFARFGVRGHVDTRLGAPSFLWVGAQSPARAIASRGPGDTVHAAREQLKALAPLYRLDAAQIDAFHAFDTQSLPNGGAIVRFRQSIGGVEVFRDALSVLSDSGGRAAAVSGTLLGSHVAAAGKSVLANLRDNGFTLDERDAFARVLDDHGLDGAALAASMQIVASAGTYRQLALPVPARTGLGLRLAGTPRVKPVFFRLPDGLVPAWYVESHVEDGTESLDIAHVISAKDGSVLFRHDLVVDAAFSYRVWADGAGDGFRPLHGPHGRTFHPHPTGTPDGTQPPFAAPSLVTLQNAPFSQNDPWLPPGATETTGNNVDAFGDIVAPDDFQPGDLRPSVTAPGVFDRVYDTAIAPNANPAQIMAAVTQLFYVNNWLHDAYYDAGFDEASGNAQQDNFGRGGLGGDRVRAQGQDFAGTSNANMMTPADGAQPRMRMYIFPSAGQATVEAVTLGQTWGAGVSTSFGPQVFDVTAQVAIGLDASPAPTQGCQPLVSNVAGKIALVDRGTCGYTVKVANAQAAGAVGIVVANNVAGAAPGMGGADPTLTLPAMLLTQDHGLTLRNAVQTSPPQVARLVRAPAPARDGTIDNGIVAHEWGHYISNRLVGNAAGLTNNQGSGMGEGWGDFHAMLMTVVEEPDSPTAYTGVYSAAGYAAGGPVPNDSYYFGIRRYPYSTDMTKNPLTFRHIQDSAPLPVGPPSRPGNANSAVHSTGEVWASMLWECYAGLLRDRPRLSHAEAETRMKRYLVAGYKMTPNAPTFVEARDALLASIRVQSPEDHALCAAGFAKRGAGAGAVAPPRDALGNEGVIESFSDGGAVSFAGAVLDDEPGYCDLDGTLDGGETGTLTVSLRNDGFTVLDDTMVSVSSPTPGVSFPNGAGALMDPTAPMDVGTARVQVALAPMAGPQTITLDIAWNDPDAASGSSSVQVLANVDYTPQNGTVDDVETPIIAWTPVVEGSDDPMFAWRRIAIDGLSHRYLGPDNGAPALTALVSPPLQVSASEPLVLTLQQRHAFELDAGVAYDGGVIEISTDAGATWTDIGSAATPGYGNTIAVGGSNPLEGRQGYGGLSAGYPAMQAMTIDLGTAYAGQTVQVRFAIGSDLFVGAPGWEIDDIAIGGIDNTPFPTLDPHIGACAAAAIEVGGGQSTLVDTAFPLGLQVRIADAMGVALAGRTVRFTTPSTGASATFGGGATSIDVVTDVNGIASVPPPTANATAGSYDVTVSFGAQTAAIALTNLPDAPLPPEIFDDSFED